MSQSVAQLPSFSIDGPHTVVKVFLVNGESRSLRLDERTDVNVSPFLPLLLLLISITQGEVGGTDQSYTQAHMYGSGVHHTRTAADERSAVC